MRSKLAPPIFRSTLAIVVVLVGCRDQATDDPSASPESPVAVWFEEIAMDVGLVFTYESGADGGYLFPEIMGGGAALFDMDGDGDLDAYLVQGGSLEAPRSERAPNRLFRNRGDGTFQDVTDGSGADDRGYGMGVAAGDYDNDGDVDLYVTNVGPNVLLRNNGAGKFTDVTHTATVGDSQWSASAAFADFDNDGDLDLFVTNYVRWSIAGNIHCRMGSGLTDYCSPNSYDAPLPDNLYRNNGDGSFTDISIEAGLRAAFGNGLGVVCGDFNADGLVDIFVANDQRPNQLWENQGELRFEDVAALRGCAVDQNGEAKAGMGTTAVDVDQDQDLDLFVVNLRNEPDSLYKNEGSYFRDDTIAAGLAVVTKRFTRFGLGVLDFDHDSQLDFFVANGAVVRPSASQSAEDPYAERNCLLRGTPDGQFIEATTTGGTSDSLIATSRAAAFGDIDNDGDIDSLVVNRDAPAHLFRNVAPKKGNWLLCRVIDRHGRDAIGATVTVGVGDRSISAEVRSAYSYCAASDLRVHFGLGSAQRVDRLEVRWPDGAVEVFPPVTELNKSIELRRGSANGSASE